MSVYSAAVACTTAADMVSTATAAVSATAAAATAAFNSSLSYILIQESIPITGFPPLT